MKISYSFTTADPIFIHFSVFCFDLSQRSLLQQHINTHQHTYSLTLQLHLVIQTKSRS